MPRRRELEFDEIGYWSEIKLEIIRDYAAAYSRILSAQSAPSLHHIYIDAFAGAGVHLSKASGGIIAGSPTNALFVMPPFREYHFIDLDERRVASLEEISRARSDVEVYHGDCNPILLRDVFPRARYKEYKRALCILDPYGLDLEWRVIAEAAGMGSVEIFLNFPVADINRNVLWRNREGVSAEQAARLTRFWGDESWRDIAYRPSSQATLWGDRADEKSTNDEVAEAFRLRLKTVAGFSHVPVPMAMRNSNNAIVYYLYFASHKPVAAGIVQEIFAKHRERGGS